MMTEGRSCLELAQQLQAAESIIHLAKRSLIQDHMEHCITDASSEGGKAAREAMAEFKILSKYLSKKGPSRTRENQKPEIRPLSLKHPTIALSSNTCWTQ